VGLRFTKLLEKVPSLCHTPGDFGWLRLLLKWRFLPEGSILFEEDSQGNGLYFILQGDLNASNAMYHHEKALRTKSKNKHRSSQDKTILPTSQDSQATDTQKQSPGLFKEASLRNYTKGQFLGERELLLGTPFF